MSGGVDSSAAAALLVEQGYEVIGATMQVWDYSECEIDEGNGTCCSSSDVDDARAVCDLLKIPFYVINCESEFREKVINPFIEDYLKGSTPLPCVNCNTYLKFDHLIRKMHELECDFLATGHYAKIEYGAAGEPQVRTSFDGWKDQTYFLFTLNPSILNSLLFPIGDMKKEEVRSYAEKRGLLTARKKDSVGICFVGNKGYQAFIESQVDSTQLPGGLIRRYPDGEVMGQHQGIHRFTYGQRKGLGLDHHEVLFVIKVDAATDTVWVGDESYLYFDRLSVSRINLLSPLKVGDELKVKIRFQHAGAQATVKSFVGNQVELEFNEAQRAITPGQAAVFYRDDVLVGGGWIDAKVL